MLIYKCTNTINNRIYVGKTIRSLEIRRKEHIKELTNNLKNGLWQEDFNIYGKDVFIFETLEECTIESLASKEIHYIKTLYTLEPFGYNKTLSSGSIKNRLALLTTSKYSLQQLENIMLSAISVPFISNKDIAINLNIPIDVIQDLLSCKAYCWTKEYLPELYSIVERIHYSGIFRSTYLNSLNIINALELYINTDLADNQIANISKISVSTLRDTLRKKSCLAIKTMAPEIYNQAILIYSTKQLFKQQYKEILNTRTGMVYSFHSISEISKILDIDHRRISELVSGKRTNYKDFIMHKVE
jgi:predicted DNA-binding protein YlxM (UPF0122 family)